MSWGAFLPFAKRCKPVAAAPALPMPDGPPPSHYPIDLEDPLPYLQVFTPLTFTSTSKLFPSSTTARNSNSAEQQHIINTTSPEQLLTVSIALTVDTTTHIITALSMSSLSGWAESELGKWIRSRADSRNVAGRDISSICWAIGRYWELAEKRANYMIKCEENYPQLALSGQQPLWKINGSQRLTSDTVPISDEDHGSEEMQDADDHRRMAVSNRRKISRHLGRSILTFRRQDVQLLIAWNVSFDWTGDAQSQIAAVASMPDACKSDFNLPCELCTRFEPISIGVSSTDQACVFKGLELTLAHPFLKSRSSFEIWWRRRGCTERRRSSWVYYFPINGMDNQMARYCTHIYSTTIIRWVNVTLTLQASVKVTFTNGVAGSSI